MNVDSAEMPHSKHRSTQHRAPPGRPIQRKASTPPHENDQEDPIDRGFDDEPEHDDDEYGPKLDDDGDAGWSGDEIEDFNAPAFVHKFAREVCSLISFIITAYSLLGRHLCGETWNVLNPSPLAQVLSKMSPPAVLAPVALASKLPGPRKQRWRPLKMRLGVFFSESTLLIITISNPSGSPIMRTQNPILITCPPRNKLRRKTTPAILKFNSLRSNVLDI